MVVKREWSDSDSEQCSPKKKVPKSPVKLEKWTEEEIKRLVELRKAGVRYEDMLSEFPGRTAKALSVTHCRHVKELEEVFTPDKEAALKEALENYQKRMWVNVAQMIGMSVAGCRKRAKELNFPSKQ